MTDEHSPEVVNLSFESSDVAEVEDYLGRIYTDMSIGVPGDPAEFRCRHDAVGAAGIVISRLTMPVSWTADLDPMPNQIVIEHVLSGAVAWQSRDYGDVVTPAGGTVLAPPSGEFSARCDHLDVDIIGLDALRVAEYAEQISGVFPDELEIASVTPISAALADHWLGTVNRVRHTVFGDRVNAQSPIMRADAFRSLAASLLTTFPNTALQAINDPESRAPRGEVPEARLREVIDFLESCAGEPVGPADITELAGMPAREIVAGLRRRRDVHPARLLWEARLRGVHQDLRDLDPRIATVREIATRWGFTNPGQFRAAYAHAFQELPEQTLRR